MLDADYQRHVPPHVRAAMDRLRDPQAVWDIFRDDDTVAEMARLTAVKRPAVSAASIKLLALGNWVRGNDAKRTFGKITRCVIERAGYVVDSGDVPISEDPLFRKGTRYRRRQPPVSEVRAETLVLRGIAPELFARLRMRAERNRHSVEAEALQTLIGALSADRPKSGRQLAEAIHRRFAALGGVDDLPSHPPVPTEPPPEFDQ